MTGIYGLGASPVTPPVNGSASTTLTIHTPSGVTGYYGFTVTATATGYASRVGTGLVSILPAEAAKTESSNYCL